MNAGHQGETPVPSWRNPSGPGGFRRTLDQPAHASALNQNPDESGKCEKIPDFLGSERQSVVCKAPFGKSANPEKKVLKANVKAKNCQNSGPELSIFERIDSSIPSATCRPPVPGEDAAQPPAAGSRCT